MPHVHVQSGNSLVAFQDSPRKQTQGNAFVHLEDVVEIVQRFGNSGLVGAFVINVTSLNVVVPKSLRVMIFYHRELTNAIGCDILYKDSILAF